MVGDGLMGRIFSRFWGPTDTSNAIKSQVDDLTCYINLRLAGSPAHRDTGDVVSVAINCHRKAKAQREQHCHSKSHELLHISALVCFANGCSDLTLVRQVLDEILSCQSIFQKLILGLVCPKLFNVMGYGSFLRTEAQCMQALEYFLDTTNKGRMTFDLEKGSFRFVDIPFDNCYWGNSVKTAVNWGSEKGLGLLLRYGATVEGNMEAVSAVLKKLYFVAEFYERSCRNAVRFPQPTVTCLKLFLRSLPRLPLSNGELVISEGLIPGRRWLQPPELIHLCRCAIRAALRRNWALPDGIALLDLPITLQRYLDLDTD